MRMFWLFAHLLGSAFWIGGAAVAMALSVALRREDRPSQGVGARLQAATYRVVVGPGALLAVVSGLMLTLDLYGGATSVGGLSHPLMMMQGAGLVGGLVVLLFSVPTASKLIRVDPVGDGPLFDALRRRMKVTGMVGSTLALLALLGGAMLR